MGFKAIKFNAIVGLAYPALAQNQVTPLFDNLMQTKSLTKNLFAFYMVDELEEKYGLKSSLTFGFYDTKKFKGEIQWHPILFKYMFGLKLDGIKVNGKPVDLGCGEKQCLVTVDSGTSHLGVPGWAYERLKGKLPLRSHGMPCAASEEFGDLTYIINGKDYPIPNHSWTFEPEPASKKFMEKKPDQIAAQVGEGKKMCRGAIRDRDLRKDMFVLGDIFMREYYTIFDRDNDRVGLAQKVSAAQKTQK